MSKKTEAAAAEEKKIEAQVLTAHEVNELVEVCLATPMEGYPAKKDDKCIWGLPLLIEGPPGIAKTARLKQLANVVHLKAKSLFAAQHPPEDFSGVLIPDGKGGASQICALGQVRELVKLGTGLIFLDEINGATPATQGALQSFIHERVIGDQEIPGRIRIIAAMNPEDIATGGYGLSAPLANRFVHVVDPGPTPKEWTSWLLGNIKTGLTASMEDIEKQMAIFWPDIYPESQALFAGFMDRLGETHLHRMPQVGDTQAGRAWPSHRTWDYAIRGWTTARILQKNDSVRDSVIEACVGPGSATAFLEYMREADIPKPMDVLDGKYKVNPDRLDIVLAAYTGAIAYVQQRTDRAEKIDLAVKAWGSMRQLFEARLADIAVTPSEVLIQNHLGRGSNDAVLKKAATEILSLMAKSGIQFYVESQNA